MLKLSKQYGLWGIIQVELLDVYLSKHMFTIVLPNRL